MKNLVIILAMLLFTSCTKILMHANGFKTPRYESAERIKSFAQSNEINEENMVLLKDTNELKQTLRLFSNSPGIIIADSSWNRLNFQNKKENCSAPVENLLMYLCDTHSNTVFYNDSNLTRIKSLSLFNKSSVHEMNASYYIFFLWNVPMGKNIKKIKAWENILKEHAPCRYQTFWINCDYMADWYQVKPGKKIRYQLERK
jgi:hypothetical protein